jgi:hypothetical protein
VHKKSQENFERKVHKRMVKAWDTDPEVIRRWVAYLRRHELGGVGMRIIQWDRLPLDGYIGSWEKIRNISEEQFTPGLLKDIATAQKKKKGKKEWKEMTEAERLESLTQQVLEEEEMERLRRLKLDGLRAKHPSKAAAAKARRHLLTLFQHRDAKKERRQEAVDIASIEQEIARQNRRNVTKHSQGDLLAHVLHVAESQPRYSAIREAYDAVGEAVDDERHRMVLELGKNGQLGKEDGMLNNVSPLFIAESCNRSLD